MATEIEWEGPQTEKWRFWPFPPINPRGYVGICVLSGLGVPSIENYQILIEKDPSRPEIFEFITIFAFCPSQGSFYLHSKNLREFADFMKFAQIRRILIAGGGVPSHFKV